MRARSSPHLKNSHLSGELRVPLLLGALPLLLSSTPLHMDPQIYYYPTQQQLVGARSSSKRETAQHAVSKGIGEFRGIVRPVVGLLQYWSNISFYVIGGTFHRYSLLAGLRFGCNAITFILQNSQ